MKIFTLISILALVTIVAALIFSLGQEGQNYAYYSQPKLSFWDVRSVDTMKYSRDPAREKLNSPEFDAVIDAQVKEIADTGATHVAIGTPYDEEFLPMLRRWVGAARKHNLAVWFRGNFSGWEEWFDYPLMSSNEHLVKTKNFILSHPDIFQDGDIFTSCPECENGRGRDPRFNGTPEQYRKFIISEYQTTKESFSAIGKNVRSNYYSMNGDVASYIMDKETTAALDGLIVIDHYVKTPEIFAQDVKNLSEKSGGKIVLGEFGAPIPDIHGNMNDDEQAQWINDFLATVTKMPEVVGINYWVGVGGSTQIWTSDGKARPALGVLKKFYKPDVVYGAVKDEFGDPVKDAQISHTVQTSNTGPDGYYELPYVKDMGSALEVSAPGHTTKEVTIDSNSKQMDIVLANKNEGLILKARRILRRLY